MQRSPNNSPEIIRLDPLMNDVQVAEYLMLKVSTVRGWRLAGKGPQFSKCAGAIRYKKSSVQAFVEAGLSAPPTELVY